MKKRDPRKQQKLQNKAIKRALYVKDRRQKFLAKKSQATFKNTSDQS